MRCIHCDNSFTCISTNNENNKFGKKYKILTRDLLPFLMNKENSRNPKPYIEKNCVCYKCFNDVFKNDTLQYLDINDACYFCWNQKKSEGKNNTIVCGICDKYILQGKEEGLRQLIIYSEKSRDSKLLKVTTNIIYHDDDFKIDDKIELDVTKIESSKSSSVNLK